ncbi:MAG: ChaN family lipoprotein [Myxococcales bacterium]|nr:ChaN family lipoprotein [Myxococcales bacterium]MCB9542851.1 ChaN family lipoprotein [Myxococcales bacterium]
MAPAAPQAPPTAVGDWQTTVHADHPLVGRIWSRADAGFITPEALRDRLAAALFVLIGEKHDNPDHHRLQAWLLDAVAHADRAVYFEMLDLGEQPAVSGAADPETLAAAVAWDASGWPPFALYRPVFAALYAAGAPIRAAHPDRAAVRASMHASPADHPPALLLDRPIDPADDVALRREIERSHCGHAPPIMVEGMVRAQRYKDAVMAAALRGEVAALAEASAPPAARAALIAGNGHVRASGVPRYLDRPALTVGLIEVSAALPRDPAALTVAAVDAAVGGRFDHVWFTPRVDDRDPCERFREQLERMRHPAGAPPPATNPSPDGDSASKSAKPAHVDSE